MPKRLADPLYAPDEWLTAEQFIAAFVERECRARRITPSEIEDDEIKLAVAEHVLDSPMFTIRNFFHTVNKKKEIVTIDPFRGQLLLDIACESQRKRGYAQRIIEIKPRQVGYTTWLLARTMWQALQPRNKAVVMVPDDEVAKSIATRLGDIYNNLGWMTPMRRRDNKSEVMFSNPDSRTRDYIKGLESEIVVVVPGPMRGKTPNIVILSEFAHIEDTSAVDAGAMLDGLLGGMSVGPESAVYIDTTPNGYDDLYYPKVLDAVNNNPRWVKQWTRNTVPSREEIISGGLGEPDHPEEGWVPVFTAAQWHEEYRTKDESPIGQLPALSKKAKDHIIATLGKDEKFGGDEEIELHKRFGASLGHIAWRRWKISTDIDGYDYRQKLLTYRQEYATSWESCFVDYGNMAFDPLGVDAISRMVREPSARGMLRSIVENGVQIWEIDQEYHSDWEDMRFWAPPERDESYVIGVDLGNAFETFDANQTYLQVLRRRDRKQVAVYEARAPMHRVRQAIFAMFKYYNNPFTAVEVDSNKSIVRELYDMGLTNQYHWKRLDQDIPEDTKYLGWETSHNTRSILEGLLIEAIAHRDNDGRPDPSIILRDKTTIDQIKNVKRREDGKIMARSGGLDDAFMSLGIALAANADPLNPYYPKRAVQQRAVEGTISIYNRMMSGNTRNRNNPDLKDL